MQSRRILLASALVALLLPSLGCASGHGNSRFPGELLRSLLVAQDESCPWMSVAEQVAAEEHPHFVPAHVPLECERASKLGVGGRGALGH
jgi:hypothetical protein